MTENQIKDYISMRCKKGSDCKKECPYFGECEKYGAKYHEKPEVRYAKKKTDPQFLKYYCFCRQIPLFSYYEEGREVLYTLSDLQQFYEKEFDPEQKKAGTDFESFLYDSERSGVLTRITPNKQGEEMHTIILKELSDVLKKSTSEGEAWDEIYYISEEEFALKAYDLHTIKCMQEVAARNGYGLYLDFFDILNMKLRFVTQEREKQIKGKWKAYDELVAKTHLQNYGIVILDEYFKPLDNEYELEEISEKILPYL